MKTRTPAPPTRMRTNSLNSQSKLVGQSQTRPRVSSGRRGSVTLPCLFFLLCTGAVGCAARTNKHRPVPPIIAVRIAEGHVVNDDNQTVEGAVVYLENPTSLAIKSYLSDAKGNYHFSQLAQQTDYELWAEKDGTQSKHKFISQFSSKTHFVVPLKLDIDPDKRKKFLGIF